MRIQEILNQIDIGSYALPEFQRGYVWNRDQVKKLIMSLYKGYPIGGLLIWVTKTDPSITRGDGHLTPGVVNLILDGQQRITSLYGIIRGHAPKFFDGNANSFTGLYFNIKEEVFEFYMATKMKDNPDWISVTELLQKGASNYIGEADAERKIYLFNFLDVLNRLNNIKDVDLHVSNVTGEDKTIDVVVEIFNNVNTGGTKLSKGDLALAKICSLWPDARNEMKNYLAQLQKAGYDFSIEWLLRCITVYMTGRPYFSELGKVSVDDFKCALINTKQLIGLCLDHIASRLGLDHDRVLPSKFAIATMIGFLRLHPASGLDNSQWNKLMYWYVHTFLWGRYAGSTESVMAQDLNVISEGEGVEGLLRLMRLQRGDLVLKADDFWGWSTGARFYPLLYLLTRVNHARDFSSGIELTHSLLGKNSTLEVHHIFPKDVLYKAGKSKAMVNSLANYAFLTKETNLEISNEKPENYMPVYSKKQPGALESHWIPMYPELWKVENYEVFLQKRRELLAVGANEFLQSLYEDVVEQVIIENFTDRLAPNVQDEEEENQIAEVAHWMEEQGLSSGQCNYMVLDNDTEVILDLAWPDGVQVGLSKPLALLLNESDEVCAAANRCGFTYLTDVQGFKDYVKANYLA